MNNADVLSNNVCGVFDDQALPSKAVLASSRGRLQDRTTHMVIGSLIWSQQPFLFFFFYFLFSPRFLSWPLKFSKNLFNLFFFNLVPLFFFYLFYWWFFKLKLLFGFIPLKLFHMWNLNPYLLNFFFNLRSFFKLNIFLNWISF